MATYIPLNTPIVWPGNTLSIAGTVPTVGAFDTSLDSGGGPTSSPADATAFVICAPQDMVISHVFPRCHSATSTPLLSVRIETVDPTTGFPTGTLWGANTTVTGVAVTATMNVMALTAAATIAKGQLFAVVFQWAAGVITISTMTMASANYYSMSYKLTNIGGATWVKAGHSGAGVGLGSSATSLYCIPGFFPVSGAVAANSFNNTSAARRGARFRVPIDCYVSGFRWLPGTALGDYSAAILDSSNVELNSSMTAFSGSVTSALAQGCHNMFFDNEVGPLSTGTDYYLAIIPSTTTNTNLYTFALLNNNYRKGFPGGVDFDYAAGTPTMAAVDTQVPMIDLLISRLPIGGGSGGGGFAGIIGM